jgi:hypothetical protein
MRRHLLKAFVMKLSKEDVVVVEAADNAPWVAAVSAPHANKVVIANPKQVRVSLMRRSRPIQSTLACFGQLYASGFLPQVWVPG